MILFENMKHKTIKQIVWNKINKSSQLSTISWTTYAKKEKEKKIVWDSNLFSMGFPEQLISSQTIRQEEQKREKSSTF